jgi:cytochrome c-type biogenesis protein CcmH/NrfF
MISALNTLPVALWMVPITFFLVCAALIWYALFRKDQVVAFFQHGKTMFRIEARGQRRRN